MSSCIEPPTTSEANIAESTMVDPLDVPNKQDDVVQEVPQHEASEIAYDGREPIARLSDLATVMDQDDLEKNIGRQVRIDYWE